MRYFLHTPVQLNLDIVALWVQHRLDDFYTKALRYTGALRQIPSGATISRFNCINNNPPVERGKITVEPLFSDPFKIRQKSKKKSAKSRLNLISSSDYILDS
jgi:hypothetical protein